MRKKTHSANAYRKDILRNIRGGKKRFFAIAVITALGVMMFSGLEAACEDSRRSADVFYDAQKLHDLAVVSTLGLTDEDVEALQDMDGILLAAGSYSEDVTIGAGDGAEYSVSLQVISDAGIDAPYLTEGALPSAVDEAVVTEYFVSETGLGIGDTFTVGTGEEEEDEEDSSEEETAEEPEEESEESEDEEGEDGAGASDDGADESENVDAGAEDPEGDDADSVDIDVDFDLDEEESAVVQTEYTITGIVIDPTDVDNPMETSSFRTTGTAAVRFFVLPEAVDSEVYTAVYLLVDGAQELWCYSDEYETLVDGVKSAIEEEIKEDREASRTSSVVGDAQQQLDDARAEAEEALSDAEQELLDGEEELKTELADAEQELLGAEQELEDGRQELEEAKEELADAKAEIADALQQLSDAEAELDAQEASALQQIEDARAEIEAGRTQLNEQISSYQSMAAQLGAAQVGLAAGTLSLDGFSSVLSGLGSLTSSVDTSSSQILSSIRQSLSSLQSQVSQGAISAQQGMTSMGEQLTEQILMVEQALTALQEQAAVLDASEAELDAQEAAALEQIEAGRAEIEANRKTIEDSQAQIADAEAEIADAEAELADGEQELSDGWAEYYDGKAEGEAELADGWTEYSDAKAEVEEKLADAQSEIDDIETASWYVQDRFSLSGYSNVDSDAESIESIAEVFPAVFLAVAILISLTTVSRMVDEDRGLFGTYKSLGFTDNEIRRKYLIYSAAACGIGSILGSVLAFVGMPLFVFMIFDVMYILPVYYLWVLPVRGILGAGLFLLGILAATWRACYRQLRQTPAALMRPKSPREGQRVFLERVKPVWNHLSFLNKVTARNIFRYKGRMFMTIFGVGGCMALLLFGFAIKDSVTDLLPRQYEETVFYDILVVGTADDNELLLSYAQEDEVEEYLNVSVTSVSIWTGEKSGSLNELTVQLIVVPDGSDLSGYVNLEEAESKETLSLGEGDVFFTRNAGDVLDFAAGDTVTMQLIDLQEAGIEVTAVVTNYMSNYVYMTESTYEEFYDTFEENALLIRLSEDCEDGIAYAEELKKRDGVASCVSSAEMIEDFQDAFLLINMVVYLLIVMSAALAFTVLFTLSTTNTSEREREIATIKVLGFYDNEVHAYINKETMILTGIGILAGLPLGYAFAQTLTGILRLPSLYLAVSLHPVSYAYSAALTVVFAAIVTLMSNRTLNAVDPATALKSVE